MSSRRIIYDDSPRIVSFVAAALGSSGDFTGSMGIGAEVRGDLVAGVLYEGFTGSNVHMHIAAVPGRRWMWREYLRVCFAYPFTQLGCRRVTAALDSGNAESLNFCLHLGFEYETLLRDGVPGGDLLFLVMWRERCRWLGIGEEHGSADKRSAVDLRHQWRRGSQQQVPANHAA